MPHNAPLTSYSILIPFRLLCFMLVVAATLPAAAQMESGLNKDSLKHELSLLHDDTLKVQAYIRLGQQYESNLTDTAIYYYHQAKLLSVKLNYPAGIVRYINNYTFVLNVQGKFTESLQLNLEAIDICRRYGLQQLLVKAIGNTGAVYQYMENYQLAADYYLRALPYLESGNQSQNLSLVYGNLCGLYRNMRQPGKALRYAQLALRYGEKINDQYTIGSACINLGNALKDMGNIAGSIKYLQRALAIGQKSNDINCQETAMIDLGDAYLQTRQTDKYIAAYKAALPLAESLDDVSGKAYALYGIALGFFWKHQYRQAEAHLAGSTGFARQHDQKEVWSKMLLLMSDVQIALGKPEASLQYRSQYDSVSNALLNTPLLKNVQELETRYGVEKKQREILEKNLLLAQKSKEAQRQRQWLILAAAGAGILLLLLFLGLRIYRQKQQLNREALQNLHAQQETMRLKAMLEGEQHERKRISEEMHDDMGSGLTLMLFLSRTIAGAGEVPLTITATAESLIKKMNEIIWTMNNEQDTLDSLVAYMRATTGEMLNTAGLTHRFLINDTIDDICISQLFRRNIYLAVKEAVHNIIKHAGATEVHIAVITGDNLVVTVHDNGKGFQPGQQNRYGNGLKNMENRMQQLNGSMQVTASQGTLLQFTAPLPV